MDANPPATMVKKSTCETPMRRRSEFLPGVLVFLLAACGEDAPAPRTPAPPASDPVQVRWLHVDTLLRGGVASLLPDGRASLDLMHLGGGTQWLGTWAQDDDLLTLTFPRKQPQLIEWSPPMDVNPPDEILLRRTGPTSWVEVRRTIAVHDAAPRTWAESTGHVPRKALGTMVRFVTQAQHDADWERSDGSDADTLDVER